MPEKIIVISTYPALGSVHNHPFSAVASYTKNTLLSVNKEKNEFSFIVLADKLEGSEEQYNEGEVKIVRCWERNDPLSFIKIYQQISKLKSAKKIFFAFEWAMFGKKKWLLGLIPFFLIALKMAGKKIYFVSHGVLLDANLVSIQMGVKKGSLKADFWSIGLKMLYWSIIRLSAKVIVFEEFLRRELLKLTNKAEKIVTIPHGVEVSKRTRVNSDFRKTHGIKEDDFLIICFGFLTWYKGSDFLVSAMKDYFSKNPKAKVKLLMVGGPTKTYKDDPVYEKYISAINTCASETKGQVKITGFVDEKEIGAYFKVSDLVIFPYRVLLSASGPLSWTFTFKKPFIFSKDLKGYFLDEDFRQALTQASVGEEEMSFNLDNESLFSKIEEIRKNPEKLEKFQKVSQSLLEERQWPKIGARYYHLLNQ